VHDEPPTVRWTEEGRSHSASWRSENRPQPPARVVPGDDALRADVAFRRASEGTATLWRGDFRNARQLLAAMARRVDRTRPKSGRPGPSALSPADTFHRVRMERARRAHVLGMLLIELEPDHSLRLGHAPDVRRAVSEALGTPGPSASSSLLPLRELLGMIGAHEWRRKGIDVPALGDRIHPHYGVFAPIRQEHIELLAEAPLPTDTLAFDIGTGTGVLSAVLARRGVARVVATDTDPRAVACARENLTRLGYADRVEVIEADLFPPVPPEGAPVRSPLVVCNPPWIPAKATSRLERAVYDPGGRMLWAFLEHLPLHLTPSGEGWLLLSDLAEHLELRTRDELASAFERSGLEVLDRIDARPVHPRVSDEEDPLHEFRKRETTSLWRLGLKRGP